jgi:hypothetical protein
MGSKNLSRNKQDEQCREIAKQDSWSNAQDSTT